MTTTDTYQLKWHSHSSHLNGSVASLLRSDRFTDVVLCTVDGSQIPAHKFILGSCSVYLSSLFDGQRSVMRMGNIMLYVVLPPEITTKALQILVEYMYKGETTVSNEVLDTVLKAGEVLKIRGLWRQNDEVAETSTCEKNPPNILNKQAPLAKKNDSDAVTTITAPKISVKKDDKLLKTFTPMQSQNMTRPMFIGPPKLVFIKTSEGNSALRPIAPKTTQTIIVTPELSKTLTVSSNLAPVVSTATISTSTDTSKATSTSVDIPRILRKPEKKYGGKKPKTGEKSVEESVEEPSKEDNADESTASEVDDAKENSDCTQEASLSPLMFIKDEPGEVEQDMLSDEDEVPISEMFHSEMTIKSENDSEIEIDEIYSPLTCELCAEVFTVPAAWVRHIEGHVSSSTQHTRKRKYRSASDDTEETTALLRCDLCQKHFPNPAEWVRHIQSTHTETELAISNNSALPKRHNRFTEGVQSKVCQHCRKTFPSHASMVIHMRTHTGERPFVCGLCNKGFNVKSNLLRHLRTLHDQIISPAQVDDDNNSTDGPDSDAIPSTSTGERPLIKPES